MNNMDLRKMFLEKQYIICQRLFTRGRGVQKNVHLSIWIANGPIVEDLCTEGLYYPQCDDDIIIHITDT